MLPLANVIEKRDLGDGVMAELWTDGALWLSDRAGDVVVMSPATLLALDDFRRDFAQATP